MMARRGILVGGGALLLGLALSSCGSAGQASYRFRVTVEVDTPQGLKSGSGVLEEWAVKETVVTSETGTGKGSTKGQAVIVDLPDGPLFVLMTLPDAKGDLGGSATQALAGGLFGNFDDYFAAVRKLGGWFSSAKTELPREEWPMMVRFRDLGDPKSVIKVNPESLGVKRIMVETTRDDVTTGIEKQLGWLVQIRGDYLHGGFTARGAPLGLDGTAFSTELGE
jgi:hypothetical protein